MNEAMSSACVYRSGVSMMGHNTEIYDPDSRWYAVWTRSRQEKVASTMLNTLGVQHYLPLKSELRQWSDRKQMVQMPVFCGYLFVRLNLLTNNRLQVLKSPGIVAFVGNQTGPLPIPDQEIEDIRTVLAAKVAYSLSPSLHKGDRVRVVRGSLAGVEGTLVTDSSKSRLLVSIEMIQQSLALSVSREDVELVVSDSIPKIHFRQAAGTSEFYRNNHKTMPSECVSLNRPGLGEVYSSLS
jgi:transcription antitermination factor NusG